MNTTNYIRIFRGDDSDALGYQTIVGTIKTNLDLTGCKAVFRFLGFYAEFDPIPEDGKLTIVIPAQASRGFPPGVGYASLKVFDSLGKIRTFTNRIPVIVDTMTPSCGCGEFEVSFSPFPELEPLKIFVGPNADDFDQYTGFVSKIIDRASLVKYGLAILADAMSEDGGNSGKAASPLAVKAAYDAIIKELVDNYYTAEQTDEAIDRVAAYYITYTAAGAAFPTYAALANATTVYSGGKVRVPTRNDYCVVLADETHQGAEYRYIYAVAEGQTTGSWQPQFPVEGVMTVDQTVQKDSQNPVSGGGVWSAIWGALAALPTGFTSLYDWCVAQLAGKLSVDGGTMTGTLQIGDNAEENIILNPSNATITTEFIKNNYSSDSCQVPNGPGTLALTAGPNHTGNLAALDKDGNPTDSGKTPYDFALADIIAPEWDFNSTYEVGDLCTSFDNDEHHKGTWLYKCILAPDPLEPNPMPPEINPTHWTLATVEDVLAALRTAIAGKADASDLPYAISASIPLTVTGGAASTTLDDRTHNVRTVAAPGSGNTTTITATLPPIVAGKSRDMFLNLTVGTQASDAGDISLSIVEPSGATVQIDIGSVEDIGIGKNEILISENALPTTSGNTTTTHWLVTVRHEDFAS